LLDDLYGPGSPEDPEVSGGTDEQNGLGEPDDSNESSGPTTWTGRAGQKTRTW